MVIEAKEFTPKKPIQSKLKEMSPSERQIYAMLQKRLPDAEIRYECTEFARIGSEGKVRATRPDFYIFRPETEDRPKIDLYLEVTTSSNDKDDPKERQKRIVKVADPGSRLVVFYRRNLETIARHHPEELIVPEKKVSIPKKKNTNHLWNFLHYQSPMIQKA